jgi:hypothetical protein
MSSERRSRLSQAWRGLMQVPIQAERMLIEHSNRVTGVTSRIACLWSTTVDGREAESAVRTNGASLLAFAPKAEADRMPWRYRKTIWDAFRRGPRRLRPGHRASSGERVGSSSFPPQPLCGFPRPLRTLADSPLQRNSEAGPASSEYSIISMADRVTQIRRQWINAEIDR